MVFMAFSDIVEDLMLTEGTEIEPGIETEPLIDDLQVTGEPVGEEGLEPPTEEDTVTETGAEESTITEDDKVPDTSADE